MSGSKKLGNDTQLSSVSPYNQISVPSSSAHPFVIPQASSNHVSSNIPLDPPPRYTRQDEAYKSDGNFQLANGKCKFLPTDAARLEHMQANGMNPSFIHPTSEEAGAIAFRKPIFLIDDSGSMNELTEKKVIGNSRKLLGIKLKPKNKKVTETRLQEQFSNTIRLMQMTESYSSQPASLWSLNGVHLEGQDVSSVSSTVMDALSKTRGGTPLSRVLNQIKMHEGSNGDLSDVCIYISSDGDPTDSYDVTQSRRLFELTLRDLVNNGIKVNTPQGIHTKDVAVSFQYIGDDDDDFEYDEREINRYPDKRSRDEERINQVTRHGSTGAWLSALDNEAKGGVRKFDNIDDDESEIKDVKKNTGKDISKKDLDLKRAVGPLVGRLDRMDERR